MKIKNILVPIDFSDFSYNALVYSFFLAEKFGAKISVLHAIALYSESFEEKEQLKKLDKFILEHETKRQQLLDNTRRKAKQKGRDIETYLIRSVSISAGILEFMEGKNFDLIVMGNHGNTGLKKFFAGSVSQRILRLSPIPVITVHKNWKKRSIDRILVPMDFSEASGRAITYLNDFKKSFDNKCFYVHVIEQDEHPEFYNVSFSSILEENPQLKTHIIKNLKKHSKSKSDKNVFDVLEGKPHKELENYIKTNQIDLIVMSCRGHNLFENILIGSTTEQLVAIAKCPVLVVPD
ncbi:MAG: universal stress protein [Bacteroidales bacterium]|nr:universal stress protein [Bacteroidales bacterium]